MRKKKTLNSLNIILIIAIMIATALVYVSFNYSAIRLFEVQDSNEKFESLRKEAADFKSHYDSLLILNTKSGVVNIRKTDTIIILEKKRDYLISGLDIKKADNKVKTDDLVKLRKIIEELRQQELAAYNNFNEELNNIKDTLEIYKLKTSIKELGVNIEKKKNDIKNIQQRPMTLTILQFRTLDKNGKENYVHEKVKTIKLLCFVQGCLFNSEPIYLIFKAPNGNIIPYSTKSNLISFGGKKVFPSVEDTIRSKGNYYKEIPTKSLGLRGTYEVTIIDNQNRTLAQKTIELL